MKLPTSSRLRALLATLLCSAGLLTGCGGGDDPDLKIADTPEHIRFTQLGVAGGDGAAAPAAPASAAR